MKRLALSLLACLASALSFVPVSHAVEILHWKRLPLSIPLVVGQERVVFVDRNVRVGVPASLTDRLRIESAGGALYLRANAPIKPTRLQLQDADTGELILIDVSAKRRQRGKPRLEPVRIVDDESPRTGAHAADTAAPPSGRETPIAVVLTRYAAQSLYAPLRTIEPVTGITPAKLRRDWKLDALLPTLPVRARALAAWRLKDEWVTAIRLTNTCPRWLDLDPRALQGNFVAATFQHPDLGPAGEPLDTTVVYVVTRGHGLAESLPAIGRVETPVTKPAKRAAGRNEKRKKRRMERRKKRKKTTKGEDAGHAK